MKLIPDLTKFVNKTTASPKDNIHSLELVLTVVIFVLLGGAFASAYYRYMEISKRQDKDKVYTRKTEKKSIEIIEEKEELIVPKGYGQDE